ncbi:MAG: hypothetical protein ATN35_08915 [Epulopiscium sp. Nele67-Bin004]|nr:MAG: hypothetical protein ATN35_08915 [Epulopiscium sp. Nele67-Bin004]
MSYVSFDSSIIQNTVEVREPVQELGQEAFLELLITQLQYQDPLDPMDNSEMLAQLAQFSALEQMTNIANITEKQMALDMVGSFIEYVDYSNGGIDYTIGQVEYVKVSGSTTYLGVNGTEIEMDQVQYVYDSSNITSGSSAFETIGKTIQAVVDMAIYGDAESTIIEGEVLEVRLDGTTAYVVVGTGDKEVVIEFENVQSLVDNPTITGREVTGTVLDDDGNEITITGIAQYVAVQENNTYIYVNGYYMNFDDLEAVRDPLTGEDVSTSDSTSTDEE